MQNTAPGRPAFLWSSLKSAGQVVLLCLATCLLPDSSAALAQGNPFAAVVRETDPLTPEQELQTFHVPPGFRVQLFAAEPQIQKPMNMAFDSRGRLWVSGSNDYPMPAEPGKSTDSIRVLEDTDGDGSADRITTFVDDITIPMGLYPYKNGVIAFVIPDIVYFEDTDGDGKADSRTKLYGAFDYSRDTHGLNNAFRRGFDGWLYACHGFNNHSVVTGADGHQVDMQSGNTYRFRLDGSRIEQFTWGQVNPFGMTFDPLGDLYNSDCHTKPITLLMRDGYYESFGKPHDGLGFVPAVMNHSHGSTAIAGVSQYTGNWFPQEFHNNLFVGNVMTSRVHRDTLQYHGSSVTVVEQPDFLSSDDPWFRPVDIQSGPDGALYVADFYNRIIGHYEVPLDHPGRDRERARIWRISYVGEGGAGAGTKPSDLTAAGVDELIAALGDPGLPRRMRATDELTDRVGRDCVAKVKAALAGKISVEQHVQLLWVLYRLGALDEVTLASVAESESEVIRIHAMRLLAETTDWSPRLATAAQAGLRSTTLVKRAAADAIAQHGSEAGLQALLSCRAETPADDPHLAHALKIAIRDQLAVPGVLDAINVESLSDQHLQWIADACMGTDNTAAGRFLFRVIEKISLDSARLKQVLKQAAGSVAGEDVDRLVAVARTSLPRDPGDQFELFQAVQDGLRKRGGQPSPQMQAWAGELAELLLTASDEASLSWANVRLPGRNDNPWALEKRHCADGQRDVDFISSLPGGEQSMATLRSRVFALPEKLSFYLCGHSGFPNQPASDRNYVRLVLMDSEREVQRVLPPRNDVAQRIEWDLSAVAGQPGYVEVVDGIDINAYAWLAISRIEPSVIAIPKIGPATVSQRLVQAAQLVKDHGLRVLESRFATWLADTHADSTVRMAAADALLTFTPDASLSAVATLIGDASVSDVARNAVCAAVLERSEGGGRRVIEAVMPTLSARQQNTVAENLAGSNDGAAVLLSLLEAGTIRPQLVRNATIQERLLAAKIPDAKSRMEKITADLPTIAEERLQLIAERKTGFARADVSAARGKAVFDKNCAACHMVQGRGRVVGPQLDGIGNRGLERILEDVLDPNRNVDVAFRSRTWVLNNGRVQSGLFRRNEGELLVFADNKGHEHSLLRSDVEEEAVSPVSIMPDNWGMVIPDNEFFDLAAYLLSQQQTPTTVGWDTVRLDARFRSEGAAVADVNQDGRLDVMVGEVWYEAPASDGFAASGWTMHEIAAPGDYGDGARGYSNAFAVFAEDINGDKWPDEIVVGFPGAPCYWFENPGTADGLAAHWKKHEIWHSACNETPLYADLFGTGRRVLVMGWQPRGKEDQGQMGWFSPGDDPAQLWQMHPVSRPSEPGQEVPGTRRFSHGLGAGDVNGDGRADVICNGGWWEQPEQAEATQQPWEFHPAPLGPDCANMVTADLNGDGIADIISSAAHQFGIWGHRQQPVGAGFVRDDLFPDLVSQTHALQMADVNGDEVPDFITGKRWWAHGPGGDPGSDQPAVLLWFEGQRDASNRMSFIPRVIHARSGIGTQFEVVDIDRDGRLDVVVSNKLGVSISRQISASSDSISPAK